MTLPAAVEAAAGKRLVGDDDLGFGELALGARPRRSRLTQESLQVIAQQHWRNSHRLTALALYGIR